MPRKSAVERRSGQIAAQLEHLRTQLAKKSRKDYTSDFRHRIWLKKSHELIAELLNELSALNEPGEYDALPAAIIADELNLRLDEVQLLIRRGEIVTTGKPAHERISREELGRLAELGPAELIRLSSQDADTVFKEAVNRLRGGDVVAAKRSYGRLIGRESLISPHALAAEIAIKLAMGKYEEAHRAITFVLNEKFNELSTVRRHLIEVLQDVFFKNAETERVTFRLLKPLLAGSTELADRHGGMFSDLQLRARYISAVISRETADCAAHFLSESQKAELFHAINAAVFKALYAEANAHTSLKSMAFVESTTRLIPSFWAPVALSEELSEESTVLLL